MDMGMNYDEIVNEIMDKRAENSIRGHMTALQLAKATQRDKRTITKTAKNIPGSVKIGGRWLFPRSAVNHVKMRRSGAPKGNKNNPWGNPNWKNRSKPNRWDL